MEAGNAAVGSRGKIDRMTSEISGFRNPKLGRTRHRVAVLRSRRKTGEDAGRMLCSSLCDPDVQINHVQGFAPFTISMFWSSIARGVIARMDATFAIETKSDSE